MKSRLCRILSDYRITVISFGLWVLTLTAAEVAGRPAENTGKVLNGWFFFLLALGCLLAETVFYGKGKRKLLLMVPGAVVSGVLSYLIHTVEGKSGIRIIEWVAGYVVVMLALILLFSYRRTKLSFAEFVGRETTNEAIVALLSIVPFIGGILFWAVVEALFEISFDAGYAATAYLFCFCIAVGEIWALNDVEEEMHPAVAFSVWYILPAIASGIMAAGYLYAMKILVLRQMPSNEVFFTMALLFAVCFPTWIMTLFFEKEGIYNKFLAVFPWLFVPLLVLQMYSLGIRIGEYGLTEERYLGIMLILFEAAVIYMCKFQSAHTERLLYVLILLTMISVWTPVVNMTSLSRFSQSRAVEKYVQMVQEGKQPSQQETKRFIGACSYLREQLGETEFVAQYGSLEGFEEAEEIAGSKYDSAVMNASKKKKRYTIHGCQMVGELNTAGFRSMNMLNEQGDYATYEFDHITCRDVDFSHFRFVKRQTGEIIEVDLSDYYEKAVQYKKENLRSDKEAESNYLKKKNRIELDDGSVLYINHFEVSWIGVTENDEEVWKISSTNISGILLSR